MYFQDSGLVIIQTQEGEFSLTKCSDMSDVPSFDFGSSSIISEESSDLLKRAGEGTLGKSTNKPPCTDGVVSLGTDLKTKEQDVCDANNVDIIDKSVDINVDTVDDVNQTAGKDTQASDDQAIAALKSSTPDKTHDIDSDDVDKTDAPIHDTVDQGMLDKTPKQGGPDGGQSDSDEEEFHETFSEPFFDDVESKNVDGEDVESASVKQEGESGNDEPERESGVVESNVESQVDASIEGDKKKSEDDNDTDNKDDSEDKESENFDDTLEQIETIENQKEDKLEAEEACDNNSEKDSSPVQQVMQTCTEKDVDEDCDTVGASVKDSETDVDRVSVVFKEAGFGLEGTDVDAISKTEDEEDYEFEFRPEIEALDRIASTTSYISMESDVTYNSESDILESGYDLREELKPLGKDLKQDSGPSGIQGNETDTTLTDLKTEDTTVQAQSMPGATIQETEKDTEEESRNLDDVFLAMPENMDKTCIKNNTDDELHDFAEKYVQGIVHVAVNKFNEDLPNEKIVIRRKSAKTGSVVDIVLPKRALSVDQVKEYTPFFTRSLSCGSVEILKSGKVGSTKKGQEALDFIEYKVDTEPEIVLTAIGEEKAADAVELSQDVMSPTITGYGVYFKAPQDYKAFSSDSDDSDADDEDESSIPTDVANVFDGQSEAGTTIHQFTFLPVELQDAVDKSESENAADIMVGGEESAENLKKDTDKSEEIRPEIDEQHVSENEKMSESQDRPKIDEQQVAEDDEVSDSEGDQVAVTNTDFEDNKEQNASIDKTEQHLDQSNDHEEAEDVLTLYCNKMLEKEHAEESPKVDASENTDTLSVDATKLLDDASEQQDSAEQSEEKTMGQVSQVDVTLESNEVQQETQEVSEESQEMKDDYPEKTMSEEQRSQGDVSVETGEIYEGSERSQEVKDDTLDDSDEGGDIEYDMDDIDEVMGGITQADDKETEAGRASEVMDEGSVMSADKLSVDSSGHSIADVSATKEDHSKEKDKSEKTKKGKKKEDEAKSTPVLKPKKDKKKKEEAVSTPVTKRHKKEKGQKKESEDKESNIAEKDDKGSNEKKKGSNRESVLSDKGRKGSEEKGVRVSADFPSSEGSESSMGAEGVAEGGAVAGEGRKSKKKAGGKKDAKDKDKEECSIS